MLLAAASALGCQSQERAESSQPRSAETAQAIEPPSSEPPKDADARRAETIKRIHRGLVGVGDPLPELTFESLDGAPVALESLRGRPTVLVFGSCTCEPFVRSMPAISALETEYRDRVLFLLVYVDEAHPTDGWATPNNPFEVARARSMADRRDAATEFRARMGIAFPIVLETMSLSAEQVFGAFPNRLVIADADGRIVSIGPPGPWSVRDSARTAAGTLDASLGGE